MVAESVVWLLVLVELALLPAVMWLGRIAGEAAYPLSIEAKRGLCAAVEDRLLNKEMV